VYIFIKFCVILVNKYADVDIKKYITNRLEKKLKNSIGKFIFPDIYFISYIYFVLFEAEIFCRRTT
jgi:hypothetical protein